MGTQHITESSPASIAALHLIEENPGITAAEIALIGGWSVFHVRNVLRYLKKAGRIDRTRPQSNGECKWWLKGCATEPKRLLKPSQWRPLVVNAPNSVFALGAL